MQRASFLTCDTCEIAYLAASGREPTVVFLGGFNSHMRGTKAEALAEYCSGKGCGYVRFDYSGHGESAGDFARATIGAWRSQALAVVDQLTRGPLVVVGSSMGAWMMLLVAVARPQRVAALVGIAGAPDMTERLIRPTLSEQQTAELRDTGVTRLPSEYDPQGYSLGRELLDEAVSHQILDAPIEIDAPVRLLHGSADLDVPWQLSAEVLARLTSKDARLQLVKDSDHRFSSPHNLDLIMRTLDEFV